MAVDPLKPPTAAEKKMCFDKVRFGHRRDAVAGAKWRGGSYKPYRCPICAGWHLTTNAKGRR
jgi:hypothetical protein